MKNEEQINKLRVKLKDLRTDQRKLYQELQFSMKSDEF